MMKLTQKEIMAVSPETPRQINLKQKVAVAQSLYLPKDGRAELMRARLKHAPDGIEDGVTGFELDSLGGVQKIYTQDKKQWYEIFLFGPIKNRDRELIAQYFGFNEKQNQQVPGIDQVGPFRIRKNYFVTT